jgi:hypothetical protein
MVQSNQNLIQQISTGQLVLYGCVGIFVLMLFLSLYRRREALGGKLRAVFLGFAGFFLTVTILKQYTADGIKILLAGLLAEVLIINYFRPRRSRYVARSEKRKAIARFERSGKRYDPKKHHIDHVVPYSRGGSSKADNLRVLEKERNLAKSDRSPWWDVFSR